MPPKGRGKRSIVKMAAAVAPEKAKEPDVRQMFARCSTDVRQMFARCYVLRLLFSSASEKPVYV